MMLPLLESEVRIVRWRCFNMQALVDGKLVHLVKEIGTWEAYKQTVLRMTICLP